MAERAIPVAAPTAPLAQPRMRDQRWALLKRALTARGAPFGAVVLALVVLMAVVYVTLNLLVDLLYGVLDPRIRLK